MAKVIEFYVRDLFPKKVQSVARDRRGEVIEFPKGKPTVAGCPPSAHQAPDAGCDRDGTRKKSL